MGRSVTASVIERGQQQVLRPSFDSVRVYWAYVWIKLARQFAATDDVKVKEEIERLAAESRGDVRGRVQRSVPLLRDS
jgi:hypothetical protein